MIENMLKKAMKTMTISNRKMARVTLHNALKFNGRLTLYRLNKGGTYRESLNLTEVRI